VAEPEKGSSTVVVAIAAAMALWFLVLVSGAIFDGVDHAVIESVLGRAARAGSVRDGGSRVCLDELSSRLPGIGVEAFGCRSVDGRMVAFAEWHGHMLTVVR
jgi:hypothetical protein